MTKLSNEAKTVVKVAAASAAIKAMAELNLRKVLHTENPSEVYEAMQEVESMMKSMQQFMENEINEYNAMVLGKALLGIH